MGLLLSLLIGLLGGYWARTTHDRLKQLTDYFKDRLEAPAGIVRPKGQTLAGSSPVPPTETDTGGIRRPTPDAYAIMNARDRDELLRRNHS